LKILLKIYGALCAFWIYLVIVALLNDNSILTTSSFLFWIIDIFPACIMFTVHFSKKKYSLYDFFNIILIVGTLQGIVALLAFFSPTIKEFFVYQLLDYGYTDRFIALSQTRINGFASNLTFSTPIVQSLLAVISIYFAINRNWKYLFFSPLLFFSAIINARISFIIIIIGFIAMLIAGNRLNLKVFIRLTIIGVITVITINIGTLLIKEEASQTFDWITAGYFEIGEFLTSGPNQTDGYFSYLNNSERYALPDGFGVLFGIGARILTENDHGARSDIGYINDIWLGGFIYSVFIYLFFIIIIYRLKKAKNVNGGNARFLFYLFIISLFITNIKGYVFGVNNLTNLLFLIITFLVLRNEQFITKGFQEQKNIKMK
jgi:hypothetical protein